MENVTGKDLFAVSALVVLAMSEVADTNDVKARFIELLKETGYSFTEEDREETEQFVEDMLEAFRRADLSELDEIDDANPLIQVFDAMITETKNEETDK